MLIFSERDWLIQMSTLKPAPMVVFFLEVPLGTSGYLVGPKPKDIKKSSVEKAKDRPDFRDIFEITGTNGNEKETKAL